MTPSPAPPRSRDGNVVDLLPRDATSSERNVGLGVAAVVGSLVLLIGVPIALVLLVGNPLPTTAPSREWLTVAITPEVVINVIAVLVWIVWVHFVVCFLSELNALRAGRMPSNVIAGGGSQLLARRLVAGVLMLSGGIGIASGLTSAATAADAPAPTSASSISAVTTAGTQVDSADTAAASAGDTGSPVVAATPERGAAKHYEVKPPSGRNHDTLWDIADRTLGNPLRYKEIFELNADRMQPDGSRLTDADLIRPGWQLLLPADATGPGVRAAAPSTAPTTMTTPGQVASDSSATAGSGVLTDNGTGRVAAPTVTASDSARDGIDNLGEVVLGGGLVLAGLAAAVGARRGLLGTPTEEEGALRLAANPVRADLLDRALRVLSETRHGQNLPMPDVSVAYLADDKVIVHLVGQPAPPAHPWVASEDGSSWTVTAEALEDVTANAPAPYPALVNIAESHGYDVLVDLEYASGLVAVGGDVSVAREVVMSTVVDLATHAWSDSVEVTLVGFGDDVSAVAPERITRKTDLDEALTDVEHELGEVDALLRRLGVDGVMSGRASARHPELRPKVLVLSGTPSSEQVRRINALSKNGRTAFAAIGVGDAPGARWRFVVDQQGNLDLGVLGIKGTARRFTLESAQRVRTLIRAAAEEAVSRTQETTTSAPGALLPETVGGAARAQSRPAADAAVRVQLLGPVEVSVDGAVATAERSMVTELVVMTALHPMGLHEAAMRAGLWPRGVTDDVVASTLRDAQLWLGVDAQGSPRLHQDDDGLWRLSSDVYVDWNELQMSTVPDGGTEAAAYLRALDLAEGELFSGTPAGRYSWLAFHRSARDARAVAISMATRASALLAKREPAQAEDALRDGLLMVPSSEVLWRDLIRLHGDRPDGPSAVVAEMQRTLPGHRFEAETEALVSHLLPALSLDSSG